MIHKIWLEENNQGKQIDIEFYCAETEEENEQFNKAIQKLELKNYFYSKVSCMDDICLNVEMD